MTSALDLVPASIPPSKPSRKEATAENWDDDFEFALPVRPASKTSSSRRPDAGMQKGKDRGQVGHAGRRREGAAKTVQTERTEKLDEAVGASRANGRGTSPVEDWDEPGPSKPERRTISQAQLSSTEQPQSGAPRPSAAPPVLLPPPTSGSADVVFPSDSRQPRIPSIPYHPPPRATSSAQHLRSGSTAAPGPPSGLIKRHPSASFVPVLPTWSKGSELVGMAGPNRSSPNLPTPLVHGDLEAAHAPPPLPIRLPSISPTSGHSNSRPSSIVPQRPLHPSKSSEQMPPPPLPPTASQYVSGLTRRLSKADKSAAEGMRRSSSRQLQVRESAVPFSPSPEQLREVEKRPGFWKRLSGSQASGGSKGKAPDRPPEHRRRRSSSVGPHAARPTDPVHPPLPPLPPNLRSTSGASAVSAGSASSAGSLVSPSNASNASGYTAYSGSSRSGAVSALSSMLRRSSSRLSDRSRDASQSPPSAFSYTSHPGRSSSTSLHRGTPPLPSQSAESPLASASSTSLSRGFHLPSPSPRSPYNSAVPYLPHPPLPHSASFPSQGAGNLGTESDMDTETEAEGNGLTPKRKKKIRPVSALPAPRPWQGWAGDGWRGFSPPASASSLLSPKHDEFDRAATDYFSSASKGVSPIRDTSQASAPEKQPKALPPAKQSTLRRLGSISKKHGRRLSAGWKFGTNSSASSGEGRKVESTLETVVGSPSKPSRSPLPSTEDPRRTDGVSEDASDQDELEDERRETIRAGSVSAPNSMFKPVNETTGGDISTDEATRTAEKHRRRQSWNDFVIPRGVLEKQKELRQGIGAVKQFATGVDALRKLLDAHARVQHQVMLSDNDREVALFTQLEAEFAQYWEMAIVLIEVGSTGQGVAAQPASVSPTRSRRITLASDEARPASEAMRRAYSNPHKSLANGLPLHHEVDDAFTPRKSSLPDPRDVGGGPPKASPPEQWRASTGRQDLSRRQLEVLKTMLRTPVSDPARPSASRQSSAMSASSIAGNLRPASGDERQAAAPLHTMSTLRSMTQVTTQIQRTGPKARDGRDLREDADAGAVDAREPGTPHSRITLPSPGDSAYIVASGSFPSPVSAGLANPQDAKRRSSKNGLAGLKEFLRGLGRERVGEAGSVVAHGGSSGRKLGGGQADPGPANGARSDGRMRDDGAKAVERERIQIPPRDTSYAPPTRSGAVISSPTPTSDPAMLVMTSPYRPRAPPPISPTLPQPAVHSRPAPPARTTSRQEVLHSRSPPLTSPPATVRSDEIYSPALTTRSTFSALATRLSRDPSPEKGGRPSIRHIFRTGSGSWAGLVNGGTGNVAGETMGAEERRQDQPQYDLAPPISPPTDREGMDDTVRPQRNARKSRILGLGWPDEPGSPTSPTQGSGAGVLPSAATRHGPPSAATATVPVPPPTATLPGNLLWSFPRKGSASPTKSSATQAAGMTRSHEVTESPLTIRSRRASRARDEAQIRQQSSGQDRHWEEDEMQESAEGRGDLGGAREYAGSVGTGSVLDELREEGQETDGGAVVVALTPENLPVLLEYLRQCEGRLGEWKVRAEGLGL